MKGAYGLILKNKKNVYFAGHLHIAAKNGTKQLQINPDKVLVNIYYHLKHSSKGKIQWNC